MPVLYWCRRNIWWALQSARRSLRANICRSHDDESETLKTPSFFRTSAPAVAFAITCGLLFLAVLAASPARAEGRKTAVFAFEFIDDNVGNAITTEVPAAEALRLKMIHGALRDLLAASGRYAPADIAPVADAIAKSRYFRDCRDCAEEIARFINAEVAVTGWVQKVSNLILNINVVISDAKTGEVLAQGYADIRGNTDESWRRGLEWIVKNRIIR
jgi:hypothetical protein